MAAREQRLLEQELDNVLPPTQESYATDSPIIPFQRACSLVVTSLSDSVTPLVVEPVLRRSLRIASSTLRTSPLLTSDQQSQPSVLEVDSPLSDLPALPVEPRDCVVADEADFFNVAEHTVGFYVDSVDVDHVLITFPTRRLLRYFGDGDVVLAPQTTFCEQGWTVISATPYTIRAEMTRTQKRLICELICTNSHVKVAPGDGVGGTLAKGCARVSPRLLIRCLLAANVRSVQLHAFGMKRDWASFLVWPYRPICSASTPGVFDIARNFPCEDIVVFTESTSSSEGFRRNLFQCFLGQYRHDDAKIGTLIARSTGDGRILKIKAYPLYVHAIKSSAPKISSGFPATLKTLRARLVVLKALFKALTNSRWLGGWRLELTIDDYPIADDIPGMLTFDFVRQVFGSGTQMVLVPVQQFLASIHNILSDIDRFNPFAHRKTESATAAAYAAYAELLSAFGIAGDNIRKSLRGKTYKRWRNSRSLPTIADLPMSTSATNQDSEDPTSESITLENTSLATLLSTRRIESLPGQPYVATRLDGRSYPAPNTPGGRCRTLDILFTYIREHMPAWRTQLQLIRPLTSEDGAPTGNAEIIGEPALSDDEMSSDNSLWSSHDSNVEDDWQDLLADYPSQDNLQGLDPVAAETNDELFAVDPAHPSGTLAGLDSSAPVSNDATIEETLRSNPPGPPPPSILRRSMFSARSDIQPETHEEIAYRALVLGDQSATALWSNLCSHSSTTLQQRLFLVGARVYGTCKFPVPGLAGFGKVLRTDAKGCTLFARYYIPRGTFLGCYLGELIVDYNSDRPLWEQALRVHQAAGRATDLNFHELFYEDDRGRRRLFCTLDCNDSMQPHHGVFQFANAARPHQVNMVSRKIRDDTADRYWIGFVSSSDIEVGQELTWTYISTGIVHNYVQLQFRHVRLI